MKTRSFFQICVLSLLFSLFFASTVFSNHRPGLGYKEVPMTTEEYVERYKNKSPLETMMFAQGAAAYIAKHGDKVFDEFNEIYGKWSPAHPTSFPIIGNCNTGEFYTHGFNHQNIAYKPNLMQKIKDPQGNLFMLDACAGSKKNLGGYWYDVDVPWTANPSAKKPKYITFGGISYGYMIQIPSTDYFISIGYITKDYTLEELQALVLKYNVMFEAVLQQYGGKYSQK